MKRIIFPALLFAARLMAQSGPPDCTATAVFSATGTSTAFANKASSTGGLPCVTWIVEYYANSGNSAISLQIEGAADSTGTISGVATGSYTALTAANGSSNPATAAGQGNITACCDSYPWIRFNLATFTGGTSLTVRAYGYRSVIGAAGGTSVTITAPLGIKTVAQSVAVVNQGQTAVGNAPLGNPVLQGGKDDAGNVESLLTDTAGNQHVVNNCTAFAVFNLSGSGNTQIVALSASKKIFVCSVLFATGTPEDVKFTEGTGSNCASGTADASGLYKSITAFAHDAMGLPYTATAGDALCLNQQNAQALGGTVWYRYQ
jgi:hypothetical protein